MTRSDVKERLFREIFAAEASRSRETREAPGEPADLRVEDPVCGAQIDLAEAVASEDHDGWAYFFCSQRCRNAFVAAPSRFACDPASSKPTMSPRRSK